MGLGIGRRPPPGRIPATAFAGASSDKALASSGIDPTGIKKKALGEKKGFSHSHTHTHTTEKTFWRRKKKKKSVHISSHVYLIHQRRVPLIQHNHCSDLTIAGINHTTPMNTAKNRSPECVF